MAARPPRRYEPGELDRTRKHLGEVSEEEARRMAGLLGGEVGLEKTSGEIEDKYRKIGELNRRRSDRFIRAAPKPDLQPARGPKAPRGQSGPPAVRAAPDEEMGYFDRLRMDFLASQPEHQVKKRSAAYAALFSFLVPVRDLVNPRIVTQAETLYFKHIENLVLSVRQLLSRYAKSPRSLMRIPYYEEILSVIRDWNLEALSRELARLEEHPRGLPVSQCTELCRLLYRPIVRLLDLDPNYHIVQALKHLHDVDLLSIPKDSPDAAKIKLAYTLSRDNALHVFIEVKQRLYPLLMKLACTEFSAYTDFFEEHRPDVLAFLSLAPTDIIVARERDEIRPQPAPTDGSPLRAAEPAVQEDNKDAAEEVPAEEEVGGSFPPEVARGLELLDQIFPQAGFKRIAEFPDLYPYFQPILKLPRGTELIPPDDPLQQVIVLVAILQEFLYGFETIAFQTMGDEQSGILQLPERMERLSSGWHVFLDEIVGKHYIAALLEYCRQVEEGIGTLRASDYAAKRAAELAWIKRRYFLPRLKTKSIRGLLPNLPADLPRLPETVQEARELLERVVLDVAGGKSASMRNPWSDFAFTVEAYITRRIRLVLSRRANREPFLKRRVSNASLVFHTLLIVRVLDYLINDEKSFYDTSYAAAGQPLYRLDPEKQGAALYNVAVEDPFELIDRSERQLASKIAERQTATQLGVDKATGMEMAQAMANRVRSLMKESATGTSFTLLPVTLRRYSEIETEHGSEAAERWVKEIAEVIGSEIRDFEDFSYRVAAGAFIIVMPDTEKEGATHLARRLLERFRILEGGAIPISMGIVEYRIGWSLERLLKTTQGAVREAAKLPSPALVWHEPANDAFIAPEGS